MHGNMTESSPTNRELTISRTVDAPREAVFDAWTDVEQLRRWSSPQGYQVTAARGRVKPGGRWSATIHPTNASKEDLTVQGVYKEVTRPERISFTHAWIGDDGKPEHETLATVTLEEHDGQTQMTFHQGEFASMQSRDMHAAGWSESFDKLEKYLDTAQQVATRPKAA